MREPRPVSPSALAKFEKDRENYYLVYLSDSRIMREPQSKPAVVGSAFDAFVKASLMEDILGQDNLLDELFESQVSKEHWDFGRKAGRYVMDNYIYCGAYDELREMMESAQEEPQFEFDANTTVDGIPIAGKPDCRFVNQNGVHVVLDWKVNGYCGKHATSPNKGYAVVLDGMYWDKPSRNNGKSHSYYEGVDFRGIEINKYYMEQISIDWADQLSMYSWMMGEEVGSENTVVCIDQIVAKPNGELPLLRIAKHRCRVSPTHQHGLLHRLKTMWECINTGHLFSDLSEEDNELKIQELERRALSMVSDGTDEGDFFAKCARSSSYYSAR